MALPILLADDHVVMRQGLRALLEKHGYEVAAEASNGIEAVRAAQRQKPGIAVLDFTMPLMNGIEAGREIISQFPEVKVILLTMHAEDQYVVEAMKAGIAGYVLKSRASDELLAALQEVASGNFYLSPGISRPIVDLVRGAGAASADPLSPRERQVLQLLCEGKPARVIGGLLHISVKTVETHRAHIIEKLGIRDIPGLVRWAMRRGLIQP